MNGLFEEVDSAMEISMDSADFNSSGGADGFSLENELYN